MLITKNFTLEELYASDTAKVRKINNTPNEELKKLLIKLAKDVLLPIRDAWEAPIVVNCGFRCEALNKAVGGVFNSQHKDGSAADIRTKENTLQKNKQLYDLIDKLIKQKKISLRQFIWEYGNRKVGPKWIHVAINDNNHINKTNQYVFVGV